MLMYRFGNRVKLTSNEPHPDDAAVGVISAAANRNSR